MSPDQQGLPRPHPALEEAPQVGHQLSLLPSQDVLAILPGQDVFALLAILALLPLESFLPCQGEQQLLALLQGGKTRLSRTRPLWPLSPSHGCQLKDATLTGENLEKMEKKITTFAPQISSNVPNYEQSRGMSPKKPSWSQVI